MAAAQYLYQSIGDASGLSILGYTPQQIAALEQNWQKENAALFTGSYLGGNPTVNAYNEGLDNTTVAAMQEFFNRNFGLNLAVDGSWGPNSQNATGWTAQQAYEIYKEGATAQNMASYKQEIARKVSQGSTWEDIDDWIRELPLNETQRAELRRLAVEQL